MSTTKEEGDLANAHHVPRYMLQEGDLANAHHQGTCYHTYQPAWSKKWDKIPEKAGLLV